MATFSRPAALACGLLVCVLRALPALGQAQPAPDERPASLFTEDVVVSANLETTGKDEVGSSVTVIGPAEIAARDKDSLLELLRTVPGVAAVTQGGPGRVGSLFMRGGNSSHTLVLLDGVRVNAAGSGTFDFADLPASDIERVEIVRGPQSSLYGSEAMGGVISITTKRGAAGPGGAVRAEAGSEESWRLSASAEGAGDRCDWRVAGGETRQPGYSLAAAEADDETLNPYRNTHATARVGMRLGGARAAAARGIDTGAATGSAAGATPAGRLEATLSYVDATAHPDSFGYDGTGYVPVAAPRFTQERRMVAGGASLQLPVTRFWNQTLRVGIVDDDLRGENPDNAFDAYDIRSSSVSAGAQADFAVGGSHRLSAGASYEHRAGENRGDFGYDEEATLIGAVLQDRWSWDERLFLTAAARYDDHSVFGGRATWRVTGAYRFAAPGTRLHASWGTGFKAPTFVDLYFPYYGNANLRPETSDGWDAGVAQSLAGGTVTFDATYFDTTYDDLIVADQDFVAANVAGARARGIEARVGYAPSAAFALEATATYTDAEDRATGERLARRPKQQLGLSAFARPGERLSLLVSWFLYRDRVEFDGSTMDDVSRVDATLDYRVGRALSLRARAQNLLDASYEEVTGYRSPGRLVSAGAIVSF